MSGSDLSAAEVRILAVIVKESPESGLISGERLNRGITGVESVDLHNSCRSLGDRDMLRRDTAGDYWITDDGWKWIADNRDAVKAAQAEQPPKRGRRVVV